MTRAETGAAPYRAVQRLYARNAGIYDRAWRRYNDVALHATLEAVPWDRAARILNLACGTGLFEQAVAQRSPATKVVGLDVTQEILRQARSKTEEFRGAAYLRAVAEELPFGAELFDGVVCANSFHHFREPAGVLREARRVLRPGGWLVLVDWCDDYWTCKLFDVWLRLADRAHFRTYGLRECSESLAAARFRVESARRFKVDWFWGLMALRAVK